MPVAVEDAEESKASKLRRISPVQKQLLQLIGQHLSDLGLSKSVEALLKETDIVLESTESTELKQFIKSGQWTQAAQCLERMRPYLLNPERAESDMQEMRWLLCEEEIKELSRCGCYGEALSSIRLNMKLCTSDIHERVKALIWEIVTASDPADDQTKRLDRDGKQSLLLKLQRYFPPEVMLPPGRLQTLVGQALSHQSHNCTFHVTDRKPATLDNDPLQSLCEMECQSLLVDHHCDRGSFPSKISHLTKQHADEVWFCKFNHRGSLLASGSKDGKVITWKVLPDVHKIEMERTFSTAPYGVAFISWSPDDTMILCTGAENCKEATVWNVQTGSMVTKFTRGNDDRMTAGGWYKDSRRFVVGGITGKFFCYNLDTSRVDEWEGVRVQGLHVLSDDTVLVADNLKRIRGFRFETLKSSEILTEENGIITFTVNSREDTILVNVMGQGIHLWDLRSRNLIGRYRGITQGTFLNHSTFGGSCSQFIASGSEDGTLAIWSRSSSDPIVVLRGHSSTVNCVTWNPILPTMVVSASDDHALCCWAPDAYSLHPQPVIEQAEDRHRAAQLGPDGAPY